MKFSFLSFLQQLVLFFLISGNKIICSFQNDKMFFKMSEYYSAKSIRYKRNLITYIFEYREFIKDLF